MPSCAVNVAASQHPIHAVRLAVAWQAPFLCPSKCHWPSTLASRKPRNLTNGAAVDCAETLSAFNKKQFHHIHPRAHLARIKAPGEHNCLANVCLLVASENRLVSDEDPSEYLPRLLTGHDLDAPSILACNVMPTLDYSKTPFPTFAQERAKLLSSLAQALCEGR